MLYIGLPLYLIHPDPLIFSIPRHDAVAFGDKHSQCLCPVAVSLDGSVERLRELIWHGKVGVKLRHVHL